MRKSILFHAKTANQLEKKLRQLRAELHSPKGKTVYANLENHKEACPVFSPRVGFVWDSREEALLSLEEFIQFLTSHSENPGEWQNSTGIYRNKGVLPGVQKLVGIFSGQGTQYPGMGRQLFKQFTFLRKDLDFMDRLMKAKGLIPISKILFPPADMNRTKKYFLESRLHHTQYTQPALGVFISGLYRVIKNLGFNPDFLAGLSFGEVLGLWASRAIRNHSFPEVVLSRGIAMAHDTMTGTMMAITGKRVGELSERIRTLSDVFVESWNSNNQLTLSGLKTRIEDLQYTLQDEGFTAFVLPVSGPFHSPLMETAKKQFALSLASESFQPPDRPVYSNLTARPYPENSELIRNMLITHLVKPIRFSEIIENIHRDGGFTFVELGPKKQVTPLIENILKNKPHATVTLNTGNRKRSQHLLPFPMELLTFFEGYPPVSCITRNISKDGCRLEGLPRSLGTKSGLLNIQFMGTKYLAKGKLIWRQARIAGVQLIHTQWTREFFNTIIRNLPPQPDAGPDKDQDRQLREAIMKLIVLGYPLNLPDEFTNQNFTEQNKSYPLCNNSEPDRLPLHLDPPH
ncbi:MAG: acyltransferase domain-containing protein [Desulfobacteraceae bacterium]|nr:acyltransferase domain-containing protein [Desulfobacteraceae bacterium]